MLEEGAANILGGNVSRKIDPADLGAQRARDSSDFYCSTLMFWLLMIEP
jgi:hypothetical protein